MALTHLTVLLLALLALVVAVLAADEEVAKHCKFTLEGQNFDLCPIIELGKEKGGWFVGSERQTPPTVTKMSYRISLSGPLPFNASIPSEIQCPEGTWICMKKFNIRPNVENELPRLLEVVPIAGSIVPPQSSLSAAADVEKTKLNVTVQLSPWQKDDVRHKNLHIRYHGGHYVGRAQQADFSFVCDHKAEALTSPEYLFEWGGRHIFQWKTKQACGEMMANEPADDTPPPPPPDGPPMENEDGSSELVDLPPYTGSPSRVKWFLVLTSTAAVAFLIYIAYHPPQLIRRHVLSYIKSHPSLARFRVGEHVLVRWADEELGYEEGEEDLMVNGERDSIFFDDDEQIPLKPSPKKKGLFPSYGVAL
ncbi:hypothetical protein BXZ70DRAFT_720347 [Cristinia sonorae]|uniref:Autophagy-related protein 27 n=1 Tax=Cristinia sonorae TaxID=1940300 RepID=A0A8K0XS19_9AGAR|nr:hypothetical protein BXZ70DRAFT_720347 [Cristinia sonorae]